LSFHSMPDSMRRSDRCCALGSAPHCLMRIRNHDAISKTPWIHALKSSRPRMRGYADASLAALKHEILFLRDEQMPASRLPNLHARPGIFAHLSPWRKRTGGIIVSALAYMREREIERTSACDRCSTSLSEHRPAVRKLRPGRPSLARQEFGWAQAQPKPQAISGATVA